MKFLLTWVGVLVGSVALGAGLYTVVVAPATGGLDVSGRTATPNPRPVELQASPRPQGQSVESSQTAITQPDPTDHAEHFSAEADDREGSDEDVSSTWRDDEDDSESDAGETETQRGSQSSDSSDSEDGDDGDDGDDGEASGDSDHSSHSDESDD